ncbi:hypothetical protein [Actinophytocola glycyrrhizae]|uniref:Secreted protein n=1 Tax=Actinophytocola glycyrrhizae TaxID=2044873 RepID=A0ABV9S8C2_9PSEU
MNATELREHLHGTTPGLALPPAFAETVLRGGRRRRARRRLAVAASVVAVVAVAASATVVTMREDAPVPVADARLTMPTKGDLAGDKAFLDQARHAWQEGLPYSPEARDGYYDDLRGDPHVYWAGSTPAGRAAVVLQQVYVHRNNQVPENGLRTAEGLVAIDPGDGQLKLVTTRMIGWDEPGVADYYKFGPDDRTALIVDNGKPLHYAFDFTVVQGDDGRRDLRFDWSQAEPDDGVAIVTVPPDRSPWEMVAFEGSDPPDLLPVGDYSLMTTTASSYLMLRLTDPSYRMHSDLLPWGEVTWELGEPLGLPPIALDGRWGVFRSMAQQKDYVVSPWTIAVGLPDGRVIILKQSQVGTAPPRLIAKVAPDLTAETMNLIDGGTVDPEAILPVRFRIPDGGGWVVADKGKQLRYRTSPDGPWQDAGRDAALLPDTVREILVGDDYVRLS